MQVEFVQRRADDLQLPEAGFDLVLCQQGIQFFPGRSGYRKCSK